MLQPSLWHRHLSHGTVSLSLGGMHGCTGAQRSFRAIWKAGFHSPSSHPHKFTETHQCVHHIILSFGCGGTKVFPNSNPLLDSVCIWCEQALFPPSSCVLFSLPGDEQALCCPASVPASLFLAPPLPLESRVSCRTLCVALQTLLNFDSCALSS